MSDKREKRVRTEAELTDAERDDITRLAAFDILALRHQAESGELPSKAWLLDVASTYEKLLIEHRCALHTLKPFADVYELWLERSKQDVAFTAWLCERLPRMVRFHPRQWFEDAFKTLRREEPEN